MTHPLTVPPLRHRLRAALTQLRGTGFAPAPDLGSEPIEPSLIVAELHQARHHQRTVTIRTRGGHLLPRLSVDTVHHRHAGLSTDAGEQLIMPLRFIESVQHLNATDNGTEGLL
ncbi:hypothetical protein ACIGO9_15235 [Nocardia asteroides]|uniref:hypothetical protein n=1 Tax=Nocardia asteroides TaxID=1824 RepID=UPI0037CA7B7C